MRLGVWRIEHEAIRDGEWHRVAGWWLLRGGAEREAARLRRLFPLVPVRVCAVPWECTKWLLTQV